MGLFRTYAKYKMGKKAFDKGRQWWKKRQRKKAKKAKR